MREPCLEIIRVLDFFRLETRSATLDGTIPLRAAQGCKPFLDGNSTGLQLSFRHRAVIRRESPAAGEAVCRATLHLNSQGFEAASQDYVARIQGLVDAGRLEANGQWHRRLLKGAITQEGAWLSIWTGLMARPSADVWILISTAWNRRCMVEVEDFILSDSSAFVPLILRLDIRSLRHAETWLDTDLATLTSLRPGVTVTAQSIRQHPVAGQRFLEFHSPEYLEKRGNVQYTGKYRQTTTGVCSAESEERACEMVYSAGRADLISIGRFGRFATAQGMAADDPGGRTLEYGVVHALYDLHVRWDGLNLRNISRPPEDDVARLFAEWAELYGIDARARLSWWSSYMLPQLGPHRGEPFLTLSCWVLACAPPGWSGILDGCSFPHLDGLRGVIAHDVFAGTMPEFQFYAPGDFSIPAGKPVCRVLFTPRGLLQSEYREI